VPSRSARRARESRRPLVPAGAVWGVTAVTILLFIGIAMAVLVVTHSVQTLRSGGDATGGKIVSWVDTRTILVESVSGARPPVAVDVLTERVRRLPVKSVLFHASGARAMIGVEPSGDVVTLPIPSPGAKTATACGVAAPVASSPAAGIGVSSPDGRLSVAPDLADGTPTDVWRLRPARGVGPVKILTDGVSGAAGDPAWSSDSRMVAIPLEPGDAAEATIVVAWAPSWKPFQIRVAGYQGGPVVFGDAGTTLACAQPSQDSVVWVGSVTGAVQAEAPVPGLGGLAGRSADGRIVAFSGAAGGSQGGLLSVRQRRSAPSGAAVSGTWFRLPHPVESAVVDPSGRLAAAVCSDAGGRRSVYIVDLESVSGRVRLLAARAI
jgi:hypothetical protein